jgi:uncharacterized protein YbjT (DUF2867 family)
MNKHMKIVVIGGSGLIGTKLVNNLRQRGHQVVAAPRGSGGVHCQGLAVLRRPSPGANGVNIYC